MNSKRYSVKDYENNGVQMWVIWDALTEKTCSHGYTDLAYANEIAKTMNANDQHQLRAEIEALKAENSRKQGLINQIYSDVLASQDDNYRSLANYLHKWLADLQELSTLQSPAPTAQAASEVPSALDKPAFMVGDRVTILANSAFVGEVGTINQVRPNGVYWVATSEVSGVLSFHETELELKYRPSWNKEKQS